ncbi:DNA2 DNA replication ATP-dependent helicase/nuclease DNA2 [Candida maltosa Xu316]
MEVLQTQTISTASKFAKSFQKGIENLEKLVIDKKSPSFEDTDDVAKLVYDRPMVRRYKIVNILKQEYGAKKDLQFILDVIDHKRETSKLVVRGEYCELELEKDDIIHIFITDPAHPKLVDNLRNLLIWNPDILLSATTIAQQIDCPRKTVVLSRYKFPGISSLPIIVGEMVHFIFQECICAENWTYDFMNKILDELLQQYLLAIFGIQKDKEDVKEEVEKHFPYLETWFKTYYKQPLSKKNVIEETSEKEGVMFAVEEALDIEEEIRSPVFGIKGKVDATVTAKFLNKNLQGKFMIPMEIKTGKEYIYHHAQASLYSLLFKDRYDMIIDSYLLVYTKEGTTKKCNIRVSDLRSLISLRNKVSQYIKDNFKLPPLVKNSSCDRCDVRTACMTLNHLTEFGTKEDCGIDEDEYETITRGIFNNDIYREYYQYWDKLIASEEDISNRAIKDLWTKNASERHGKCFDGMKIVESNDTITSNFLYAATHGDKSQQQQSFKYSFAKADARDSVNLLQSQFNVSDRVIISDEEGHYAITTGTIKYISRDKIVISARRRIITSDYKLKNYNRSNNQVFQSVLRPSQINSQKSGEKKFRIDKDEMFYGLGLARYNVLNLFLPHGATKIRKLVVDFEKPSYADKNPFPMEDQEKFNQDQVAAFEKIFTTKDYSLVLGMPGTGKTTVIAQIIKVLVQQDKSVLLTSYTNSAVDNILLKLKELGIDFLRIGHPQRVHKDIHTHIPGFREPITTYNQYVNTYMSPKVVATTCLGITDVCFSLRDSFDYCIVDEASQITLPINLGPLSFGKKFVLVGDHQQLPPLVLHPDQKVKQGLSQSLFKILAERHPQSVCELTYQYRMCKDIMEVSNILVYGNRLKCGSDEVAERSLTIPRIGVLDDLVINKNLPTEYRWMNDIFQKQNKVLFLDHDNLPALEETIGDMVRNPVEAKLTQQIVHALVSGGVTEDQIGIMSLYRSQVDLLRRTFGAKTNLEILTADQYQGRDKECIIISLVKSNERKNSGDLLKEWRRLNVAITRARSKLIILGSRSTLSSTDTTKTFIDFLENKGWYYMLPEDAHLMYNSPKVPTMTQSPIKTRKNTQESVLLNRRQVLKNVIQDITN